MADTPASPRTKNLAARPCAEAPGGQILIAPRAYASVVDLIAVEAVGPLQLKGFHEPISAYNVTGLTAPALPAER
jgi:class 3 adenylate cyclase